MAYEWQLDTAHEKMFLDTVTVIETELTTGVDEDGNMRELEVKKEATSEVPRPHAADRVRVRALQNDKAASLFHVRLIYGRVDDTGRFQSALLDDGIIIGGPDYQDLDTNEDGLISEDEVLNMSAKLLGWDGSLALTGPPEEGPA